MKKQYKILFYMQCCLAISYLNAAAPQGWWDWATSIAQRARENMVQEYMSSGRSTAASLLGSGIPGSLLLAAWVYGQDKQITVAPEPAHLAALPLSPQLQSTQSPVQLVPRSSSVPNLMQLAARTQIMLKKELQKPAPQKKDSSDIPYSWAVAEFQGKRPSMEDAYIITFEYPYLIAAVYDGHDGPLVAYTLANGNTKLLSLHKVILQRVRQPDVNIKTALKDAFIDVDQALRQQDSDMHTGSTAVVLLFNVATGQGYCAWVGDSRCLIIDRQNNKMAATIDHKPSNPNELSRVERAGGEIIKGRVYRQKNISLIPGRTVLKLRGGLNMTRAFGDFYFAGKYEAGSPVISAEPEVISFDTKGGHYTFFLGCDGIFEPRVSNLDVVHMITKPNISVVKDPAITTQGNNDVLEKKVADIVQASYLKGSTDNMTAIIIDVKR